MRTLLNAFVFSVLALSSYSALALNSRTSSAHDPRPGHGWYPLHPDSCACNELDRRHLGFLVAQQSGFLGYDEVAVAASSELDQYLVDGMNEHNNTGRDSICRAGVQATQLGWNRIKAEYRRSGWDVGNYCGDQGSTLAPRQ